MRDRPIEERDASEQRAFALVVVKRLREAGYESLWAGGCVRDELLKRRPKDYDVATNARPEQVQIVFGPKRTHAIGAAFGVIAVIGTRRQGMVEVTTFRHDERYSDGRRPDSLTFGTAENDAQRRDFTINGLFFDPIAERVIDYVGGIADLNAGVLRAIGDARARFNEDKLRMLRAVRMASTFGFVIDPATEAAMRAMAAEVTVISAERIAQELRMMLVLERRRRALELLRTSGLLDAVLAEIAAIDEASWELALAVVDALPHVSFPLVMASLFAERNDLEAGALHELVNRACRRLKLSNEERHRIEWLVRHRDDLVDADTLPWSRVQRLLIAGGAEDLVDLHEARARVQGTSLDAVEFCRGKLRLPAEVLNPPPLLGGDELIAHGVPQGPHYAEVLEVVRNAQLDGEVQTHGEALAFVDRWLAKR
jgi:poly(A) polymerase